MSRGYESIPRNLIDDMSLSLKALGLLVRIKRLPKDWRFSINGLVKISGMCAEATASVINELIEAGYCVRTKTRDNKGHIVWHCSFITEKPHTEKPHTEKQGTRNNINIITTGTPQTGTLQTGKPLTPKGEPELSYEKIKTKEQKQEYEKAFLLKHNVQENTPLFKSLMDWFQFRRDIKKPFKSEMSLERCLKQVKKLSNGETERAIEVIDQSIANGWQGLFELKQNHTDKEQKGEHDGDGLQYGERIIENNGTQYRTYGNSGAVIPLDAPHRPGWDYQWDAEGQNWYRG